MKENSRSRTNNIILISFLAISIALNIITNGDSIVVDIFALVYGLLIILLFKNDSLKDKVYFFTLLFAIMDFTFLIKIKGRYDIYFYFITTFIYLLFMLKDIRRYNLKAIFKNNYFRFLLIFVVYMIISVIWSADRIQALKSIINYIIMISLMIVVIDYNVKPGNIKKSIQFILYMLPGIIMIGLVEITGYRFNIRNHYIDENLYWLDPAYLKKIPTTFFYSPNNYGVFIVLAMAFLLVGIIYCKKLWAKAAFAVLYFLLQINVIYTTSRTAWIGLFIIYIFAALIFLFRKKKKELLKTLVMCVLTFAVFVVTSSISIGIPYFNKLNSETNIPEYGETGSVNERYTLIIDIVDGVVMQGHPLGYGVGNIGNYLKTINNTNGITNPHSLWFELLGDFGIPILLLFGIVYLSILYKLYKRYKMGDSTHIYALGLLLSFFGFAFLSFAPSSVISYSPFWTLLGLGIGFINSEEKSSENIDIGKLVP